MRHQLTTALALLLAAPVLAAQPGSDFGPSISNRGGGNSGGTTSGTTITTTTTTTLAPPPTAVIYTPVLYSWMNGGIRNAWNEGYYGQGTTITTVDDFSSTKFMAANLGPGRTSFRHGGWVREISKMHATSASIAQHDFYSAKAVALYTGLNVLNLSYSMYGAAGSSNSQIGWSAQESSIINYARNGSAVIAKAAGNDGITIGGTNSKGQVDYLNAALVGAASAIFVGALDRHGAPTSLANLTSYSNRAGNDPAVQNQYLAVGVISGVTGLSGTSFAAPIVSGYAAVIGSKFTSATPTQIARQLLDTAKRDSIKNYNPALHGRGEASITRALAPLAVQ